MNDTRLNEAIQMYLDEFNIINGEHQEYYKWDAFKHFTDHWDIEAENFAEMFKESVKLTSNLINNNYEWPTTGIEKLAEMPELTETVRGLFSYLFQPDNGNINSRQTRINEFCDKVNMLLDEHMPGCWKYKHSFRTALFYLNMRYPKENYLYKSTQAREFMYYTGYDDFGYGKAFSLKSYYNMCDTLVEKINSSPALIDAHSRRMTETMLTDDDYHIMAFDIIYCISTYNLYPEKPTKHTTAKQQRTKKVDEFTAKLDMLEAEYEVLISDKMEITEIPIIGLIVNHKKFGEGKVVAQEERRLTVKFSAGEKIFSVPETFASGILVCGSQEVIDLYAKISDINKKMLLLNDQIKTLQQRIKII